MSDFSAGLGWKHLSGVTYFTVKQSEGHTESENRELICGDGSQSEGEEEEMVIRSVSA